jgi:hypothetical protein
MMEFLKQSMVEFLKNNGIEIDSDNYKQSTNYATIKDERIFSVYSSMTVEETIERYLLEKSQVLDTYENIYDMGNPYELADNECQDSALAREIITEMSLVDKNDIEAEIEDFVKKLNRQGGLKDRLKKHLDFKIELFDVKNHRLQGEICKILYFFYMLEHKCFPKTNVLELLSNPSMENIDNSFWGMATSNGIVVKTINNSLEKELSLTAKNNIKNAVSYVVSEWDKLLENTLIKMDYLAGYEYECDFESIISLFNSVPIDIALKDKEYKHSPIETLYLKILQHEQIGQIKDILFINKILMRTDYNVPLEFVREMKIFHNKKVDVNNVKNYIDEKASEIAKYIYLKVDTDKEDHRRIRYHKEKVNRIIEFCIRTRPLINIGDIVTELWIISCLQAIISDCSNETFDYVFHAYENQSKRKQQVQGAIKGNKQPYDALQIYWVRKVTDHWYANIGRHDMREKLREFEDACDSILIKILGCPNIDEMLKLHSLYYNSL